MSLHKECADHLRANYCLLTGEKLRAGHAHEIVAAYFGYGTAAALRAESPYPLTAIGKAEILIPNLDLMDQRLQQVQNLPVLLPSVDNLARQISNFLEQQGDFTGEIWNSRDLGDEINSFVQRDTMMIEEALLGEMATTNAYFDELYIDDVTFADGEDTMVATLSGSLNGENDQDRAFHGDKIRFTTVMTFPRVAGRVAFLMPELETSGQVDDSMYYDD